MSRLSFGLLSAALALAVTAPANAQINMLGMKMPMGKKAATKKKSNPAKKRPEAKKGHKANASKKEKSAGIKPHAKQSMGMMPGMTMKPQPAMQTMPGMVMPPTGQASKQGSETKSMPKMAMPQGQSNPPMTGMGVPSGTDLPAGNAPPPAPSADHAADYVYSPAIMANARKQLRKEGGGQSFYRVLINLGEFKAGKSGNGYRWNGEAWVGGDINRLWLKSEGEGSFGKGAESAEAQALYSHAISPYFNLQAGVRHDFAPRPRRTYAALGVEGMAPYFFDTEASLFVSTKGDLLARAEGWYDELITQRLVLQPRIEANFAAQNVAQDRIGSGLSNVELGLRLRYEVQREFAPYVGISYSTKFGRTASYARRDGEDVHATNLVVGVRTWF